MESLVSYESSSEEETSEVCKTNDLKSFSRNSEVKLCNLDLESSIRGNGQIQSHIVATPSGDSKRQKLEVPAVVKSMFGEKEGEQHQDDPALYQGKIRSFSHERGNWASFVYIPWQDSNALHDLIDSFKACLEPTVLLYPIEDLHITLSHTFVLRHHWIDSLLDTLSVKLNHCSRSLCDVSEIELYCNDEGTRTFFGLKINNGTEDLKTYVKEIDSALQEFKLPIYYEDPSFHISIGWTHGNIKQKITTEMRQKLQNLVDEYFYIYPKHAIIDVNCLFFRAGNKVHRLPLS